MRVRGLPALVSNHVVDLVNTYPSDQLPEALTGYIRDRAGDDQGRHAEAFPSDAAFVRDDVVDRFTGAPPGAGRSVGPTGDSRVMGRSDALRAAIAQHANGDATYRGAHLDGEMYGPWESFRTNGSMLRSGAFECGSQVGIWRTYDLSGTVIKKTDLCLESRT